MDGHKLSVLRDYDLLDHKVRCNRDRLGISNDHVYAPGDMDNMFSEIETKFGDRYGVNVLSTSPWVVTFDNFLTDIEITELIRSVNNNWSAPQTRAHRTSSGDWANLEQQPHQ